MFSGVYIFFFNFYETPIASAVKNCMIKFSKLKQIELFLHVFWKNMFLLKAAKNLKYKCTTKRSPIAGLGI